MEYLTLSFLLLLYFFPVVIAYTRGHHNTPAIFIFTLVFGWSGVGWLISLVWSFTSVNKERII